jgi:hypothetical protein
MAFAGWPASASRCYAALEGRQLEDASAREPSLYDEQVRAPMEESLADRTARRSTPSSPRPGMTGSR